MSYPVYAPTIGNKLIDELDDTLALAVSKHKSFPTLHHGIGVILEEYQELEREIFKKKPSKIKTKKEALQLAAMCLRLIKDLKL